MCCVFTDQLPTFLTDAYNNERYAERIEDSNPDKTNKERMMDLKRRSFLTAAAAGAGVFAIGSSKGALAQVPEGQPFAKLPLKVSCSYGWLKDCLPEGSSPVDIFKLAAQWGFPAVENLGAGEDRRNYDDFVKATNETGVKWSCIMGAGRITQGEMLDLSQHDRLE